MNELTILTGASRGLGHAIMEELLARRLSILIIGRDHSFLPANAVSSYYLNFDLTKTLEPECSEFLSEKLRDILSGHPFQKITFINNAGVVDPIDLVGNLALPQLAQSIAVNFLAPALIANICLKQAQSRQAKCRILNISSGAANHPIQGWAAYCSTKAAIKMFLSVQEIESECEVFHIDPGVMNTDMQSVIRQTPKESFPDVDGFIELVKDGKLKKPNDVAAQIVTTHYGPRGAV